MDNLADLKLNESSKDEHATLDGIVWNKLNKRVLPLLTAFFLLSSVDKTNIGNARIAGFQKSLEITNYQYTLALTLTYIPYCVAQLPSTLLLKHVGPDFLLPGMVTLWGIVAAIQGLISNYSGLLACRFFLGLIEGGLLPTMVLYLSFFYPRKMLQLRVAFISASTSLASAFSGLLAAAIDHMNGIGGRPGWAWIFIMEGLFTFAFGLVAFFLLPRSPASAHFLTDKERAFVISTLKNTGSISEDSSKDQFSWIEVMRALKSPHVWFLSVPYFISGCIQLGLSYFGPTIVASLGYTGNHAQLMSVPPFAVAFAMAIVSAIVSDRYQCRGFIVIFFSVFELIGFSVFYASSSNRIRYASLFFSIVGANCSPQAHMTWLANNSAPHTRRATAVGLTGMISQFGGILATWLLGSISPAPKYRSATIIFITMSLVTMVFATINLIYLRRENRLKAKRRTMMTKEEGADSESLGDRSAWFVYSL